MHEFNEYPGKQYPNSCTIYSYPTSSYTIYSYAAHSHTAHSYTTHAGTTRSPIHPATSTKYINMPWGYCDL